MTCCRYQDKDHRLKGEEVTLLYTHQFFHFLLCVRRNPPTQPKDLLTSHMESVREQLRPVANLRHRKTVLQKAGPAAEVTLWVFALPGLSPKLFVSARGVLSRPTLNENSPS